MSAGAGGGGGGASITIPESNTDIIVISDGNAPDQINISNVSGSASSKNAQLTLTPRFTLEEKELLYKLFHDHQEVIDIKFRKKQRNKCSVRDAWEEIVQQFNSTPGISATRNLKQIQKFWLNARLRKQYPYPGNRSNQKSSKVKVEEQLVEHIIKDEPEIHLHSESSDQNLQNEQFEEIDMENASAGSQIDEEEEDPMDTQEQHHEQMQQQATQHQQNAALQTQIDQISAEKLTLTDLLHFKPARAREESIILQIKHPNEQTGTAQITLPHSPTRITIPTHHQQQHTMATITANGYNQVISELKPQQITLAEYQAQQHQQQLQQQQQQHQLQQLTVVQHNQVQQHHQQQQNKLQIASPATQFSTATPTFTCTTYSAVPASAQAANTIAAGVVSTNNNNLTSAIINDPYQEKINYFKLKEAELRFKEEQVALEKKKLELNRAQEELKNMREMHRLKVEEVKMKIRILQEEEKQLRKHHSSSSAI